MTTVKFTINTRINANLNTSTSLEFIVNDEEEAKEAGKSAYLLSNSFIDAFIAEASEE